MGGVVRCCCVVGLWCVSAVVGGGARYARGESEDASEGETEEGKPRHWGARRT